MWTHFSASSYQCPRVDSFLRITLPVSWTLFFSYSISSHTWVFDPFKLLFAQVERWTFFLLHVHTLLPYHHTLPVIFACFWHLTFVTYRWSNHIKILMSLFTGVEGRQRTREGKRGRGKGSRRTRHYYFDINFCYEIATYCLVLECNAKVGSNSLHLEKWNKNIILWPLHMHTHTCVYKTHTQNLAVTYCTSKIQWQSIKTICFYCLK